MGDIERRKMYWSRFREKEEEFTIEEREKDEDTEASGNTGLENLQSRYKEGSRVSRDILSRKL